MENSPAEPPAIDVSSLRVVRGGKEILPDLSLAVPRGAVVGLLGPSGAGKSTLIRAIVGAQIIAGGTVTVLGHEAGSPPIRARVGYVTQAPSIYLDLTVRENVAYFASLVGAAADTVPHTINAVGLADQTDQLAGTLSGGQLTRASLAAALVGHPEVLILDEPTVGLDPAIRNDLWALFRRFAEAGTTIVVSSHVMDEAVRCDRLVFIRDGRVLADGTLAEILAETGAEDAERAFLTLAGRSAA
ncbi:ABC transporter ATP-binding protein [Demequina sp. SYSU T00039]|uniref:ABC transporter ATP-binding protein n=1 Tax=Demequina lignilytica TaxID=3051663 RepID=A0AAW7M8H9_9MICO|nr:MULTISPECIES: ABC transporter ATP-binding protein [unclassified Demequina]MDN4477966.1 ABC transporter ATP-binding protein [Demequina sp. SYSU T00039-1]MDN4487875.1 ABC transporter ATP-binding protein [Demequina sp. SYSU T00039]MDN4490742.1 ABC transporter ATP-binding protein [Demequina sp. SYSU T00068]